MQCAFSSDYFQQKVEYTIHVSLDDKKHALKGDESIIYTNNSPDSLTELYFHLWPNAYKNDETALADQLSKSGDNRMVIAKDQDFGYIDGISFRTEGKAIDWEYLEDTIDVCVLHLKKALQPGASMAITTNFKVFIPSADLSRLGHDGQAYFITQWYPKPAVYDMNGWNYFPYLDKGEYYSEFGTFDVYLTLPKNYVVAATGNLVGGEDELSWLNEKAKATQGLTSFESDMSFPESDTADKTLHYHAEQVHDFAWFADKRYHVLKAEVELPVSKRKVTTWAMFTNQEPRYWLKANDYTADALTYFSKWIGEYPYDQFTCADVGYASGSGMEYPMITAIGTEGDVFEIEATIQHEIGHNWFYGVLGTNERLHPWMDEGMTQFLETRYTYTKYADDSAQQMEHTGIFGMGMRAIYNHRRLEYLKYWHGARANTDQQPDLNAAYFSNINYSADAYRKSALSFDYLKCYLGDSIFDQCMHDYFDQWKFKHPAPNDLKKVFEKSSGKKLDWLFTGLIKSTKKIDYKICNAKGGSGSYNVRLKNTGSIASPVSLSAMKNGKVQSTEWYEGFKGSNTYSFACNDCDAIKIDGEERIPEPRRRNNTIRTSGILRKIEKIKIQIPVGEEDPTRSQIYLAPAIGWNNYNKWMFGGAIHNLTLIEKRFEYLLAPIYALGTRDIAGGGRLSYNIYPDNNYLNKITLSTGVSTYAYDHYDAFIESTKQNFSADLKFLKISSAVIVSLLDRKKNPDDYSFISLRHVYIEYDRENFTLLNSQTDTISLYKVGVKKYSAHSYFFSYSFGNFVTYNPYDFNVTLGQTLNLVLASMEYNQTFSFNKKGRGVELRVFAGFNGELEDMKITTSGRFDARFHANGQTGNNNGIYQDYIFDETFMGRSEDKGLLSQQFTATQGGLKVATDYVGQAKTWLGAINVKVPFPGKLPLYFFADIATFDKQKLYLYKTETDFVYDAGIEVRIIPKILSVYFPFLYSANVRDVYDQYPDKYGSYWKKIRFELNISKLNPFTLRDQVRF
ncbi:MAG: M1 family metallopeptidase [Bacteroidota bacterium]